MRITDSTLCNVFLLLLKFPRKTLKSPRSLPVFLHGLTELMRQQRESDIQFPIAMLNPQFKDRFTKSGNARGHYFHQDLLVARKVYQNNPKRHVDVGSSLRGFVAHVASFRSIEVIDIRTPPNQVPNITFIQADMMGELHQSLYDYCDSLSCLHALEHFGLGRYGDPIRYDGHLAGLENMRALLKNGGKFYLSVPIGPQRIEYNAHRVFSLNYLFSLLREGFLLDTFSFVDDRGDLFENVPVDENMIQSNCGCMYGCGIFELTKR